MRIRWTVPATEDLDPSGAIWKAITQILPSRPYARTIYQRVRSLKTSPKRGRPGHRTGTRELTVTPLPYVVVYRMKAEAVEILHIYHGAQDWRQVVP